MYKFAAYPGRNAVFFTMFLGLILTINSCGGGGVGGPSGSSGGAAGTGASLYIADDMNRSFSQVNVSIDSMSLLSGDKAVQTYTLGSTYDLTSLNGVMEKINAANPLLPGKYTGVEIRLGRTVWLVEKNGNQIKTVFDNTSCLPSGADPCSIKIAENITVADGQKVVIDFDLKKFVYKKSDNTVAAVLTVDADGSKHSSYREYKQSKYELKGTVKDNPAGNSFDLFVKKAKSFDPSNPYVTVKVTPGVTAYGCEESEGEKKNKEHSAKKDRDDDDRDGKGTACTFTRLSDLTKNTVVEVYGAWVINGNDRYFNAKRISIDSEDDIVPVTGGDLIAPTVPGNLAASAASTSQIDLTWSASTDNVGVAGYNIYNAGTKIGSSATPAYSDTGLTANTQYCYTVTAYDAALNESAKSTQACATTKKAGPVLHPGWTKQFGTTGFDEGRAIAVDPAGNIYVTGYTMGGLDGNTNQGGYDVYITKYDTNGNRLWTKQPGTTGYDYGNAIAVDSAGNVYVTGFTLGGLDGNINQGQNDIFITKYDTNGNWLWTKQPGTTGVDIGFGIAVDGAGNVYVTGYTDGGLDGNTNQGGFDVFISKYDTNGNRLWTKEPGSAFADYGMAIAVDSTGNVYVTGYTDGGLDGNTNHGGSDVFISKYDTNGNRLWTKEPGSAFADYGMAIAVDSTGNVYVTGYTQDAFDGNVNQGGNDAFITKYDTNGNWLWTKQPGTAGYDYGYGIAVDAAGNVYAAGYTMGSLDGNVNQGGYDAFVTKYDTNGVWLWTKEPGTASSDYCYGVALDSGGNVYAVGHTMGGLGANTNLGSADAFIISNP